MGGEDDVEVHAGVRYQQKRYRCARRMMIMGVTGIRT